MDVWGKIYKDHWAGRNSLKRMMPGAEEILSLSVKRRLQLVEESWDSIALYPRPFHLRPRSAENWTGSRESTVAIHQSAKPWSEVRDRLQKRKK